MYRVYIITNAEGRRYIGLSENVETRLGQHNAGISKWTKNKGPWVLEWTSEAMSLGEARELEKLLKSQKGGAGLKRIAGIGS